MPAAAGRDYHADEEPWHSVRVVDARLYMKALVYHGPGAKSRDDVVKPAIIGPGDALVRVTHTAICGTDLHILKGDVPSCLLGRITP